MTGGGEVIVVDCGAQTPHHNNVGAPTNVSNMRDTDVLTYDTWSENVFDLPFVQDVPARIDFEHADRPPVLPPHLLQVILNMEQPVERDPNVLAEPNHVMLNHMYAQSIKVRTCNVAVCIRVQDGVMIMSATHRYKKKYVTTLLYKPTAQH